MNKVLGALFCILAGFVFWMTAEAHHSTRVNYQMDKFLDVSGVVKEFRLVNPHSQLVFVAQGEDGKPVTWTLELASPGNWARNGWGPHAFKPGDKISVHVHPSRTGAPIGTPGTMTMADGTVVGFGGDVVKGQ